MDARGADARLNYPTGIAVDLGEDDPGQFECRTEGLSRIQSVLSGHRINDEQPLVRPHGSIDRSRLGHQLRVDVQAASGIDDEDIEHPLLGSLERRTRDMHRIVTGVAGMERGTHLLGQALQLGDRRRTAYVGADQ